MSTWQSVSDGVLVLKWLQFGVHYEEHQRPHDVSVIHYTTAIYTCSFELVSQPSGIPGATKNTCPLCK